jgi:hypothetical protein
VRRTLGELVRRGPSEGGQSPVTGGPRGFGEELDAERADAVLPVLCLLLGAGTGAGPGGGGGNDEGDNSPEGAVA